MDKRTFSLIILIIIIGIIIIGLIGWQTGFVIKENEEESKGGLKLINQKTESSQNTENKQGDIPVSTGEVIKTSRGSSGGGGGSSGGGSSNGGGSSDGTNNLPDNNQRPIVKISIDPLILASTKTNEFTINVKISTQEKIYATEFELSFNSSIINVLTVKENDFLKQDGKSTSMQLCEQGVISEVCPVIDNINGKIKFSNTRLGQVGGVLGEGSLAEIKFKAVNTGKSDLILNNVKIADTSLDVNKFQVNIENSKVTIS